MDKLIFICIFSFLFLLASCTSEVNVISYKKSDVVLGAKANPNKIKIINQSSSNVLFDSFVVNLNYTNDLNSNSSATFFYCNQTDNPGCDPLLGTALSMTRLSGRFTVNVTGLITPNDPTDLLNTIIVPVDADGVVGKTVLSQIVLGVGPSVTKIYRSVGHGSNSAIINGTGNNLTVNNGIASFAAPLPGNVGVGDVIQFDSNNSGIVDKIIFIHGRVDSSTFIVREFDGSQPLNLMVADQDWEVFRAYEDLVDAENGIENSGISIGLRNFDTWSGGNDLVTPDIEWNFTLYNDAEFSLTTTPNFNGWVTSPTNRLIVYAPSLKTEVGESQSHDGDWNKDSVLLSRSNGSVIYINQIENVTIKGLKIHRVSSSGFSAAIEILGLDTGNINVENNIIAGSCSGTASLRLIFLESGTGGNLTGDSIKIGNNIIMGLERSCSVSNELVGIYFRTENIDSYIYNNTIVNMKAGLKFNNGTAAGLVRLKNNLFSGNSNSGIGVGGNPHVSSNNNFASDGNIYGANSIPNQSIRFNRPERFDYRLSARAYNVLEKGENLSTNIKYKLPLDISGKNRNRYDIGAHNAPKGIFRSVGIRTSALASGSSNGVTIINGVATFSNGLPENIGTGDVLEYDASGDSNIDGAVFISSRIDSLRFLVRTATGAKPTDLINPDNDWSILRAYTSIADAFVGTENSSLDNNIKNFDSWVGARDIVSEAEQWHFSFYADGVDSAAGTLDNWDASSLYNVSLFSPVSSDEVGKTQRHSGKWKNTLGYLKGTSGDALFVNVDYTIVDGLQIETSGGSITYDGIQASANELIIKNNIIRGGGAESGNGVFVIDDNSKSYTYNNIIYDITNTIADPAAIRVSSSGAEVHIYNNTIFSSDYGIRELVAASDIFVKNNLVQSSLVSDFDGTTFHADSANNLSSDTTSTGTGNDIVSMTSDFQSIVRKDFRLSSRDKAAKNFGLNLELDKRLNFQSDIMGNIRNSWDIGAHESATAIIRSVGFGNNTSIDNGAGNNLTIFNGIANFGGWLNQMVGVGDVLQYDSNGDGSADSIVYIYEFINGLSAQVRKMDGGMPDDMGIIDQDWKIFRAYTSLSDWQAGTENSGIDGALINFDSRIGGEDLVESNTKQFVAFYSDAPDTSSTQIIGWNTTEVNNIQVFAPTANDAFINHRHEGKWANNKSRFISTDSNVLNLNTLFTHIEGIQFELTGSVGGISVIEDSMVKGRFYNNIIKNSSTGTALRGMGIQPKNGTHVYNNIIYGFNTINSAGVDINWDYADNGELNSFYNNTVYGNTVGVQWGANSQGGTSIINNLIIGNTTDFGSNHFRAFEAYNNATTDGTATLINSGTTFGSQTGVVPATVFQSEDGHDLRLKDAAREVIVSGLDLSFNGNYFFNKDLNGQLKQSWDLGAHEAATEIYRSIGPGNVTALAIGTSNNMVILNGTAAFSVPLSDSIGVGDVIEFDSDGDSSIDSVVFIKQRNSSSSYIVQSADGSEPSDLSFPDNDWSIFRAYTSLANAESGIENTGIDDNVEDFDSFSNGKDIKIANESWNFACYADGTASRVTIGGWQTSNSNRVRFFTPSLSSEVGLSQRHTGKWDTAKFHIVNNDVNAAIVVSDSNIVIDGLQIQSTANNGSGITGGSGDVAKNLYVSNNYIDNTGGVSTAGFGINIDVYGFRGAAYIFNNIVTGYYRGIYRDWGGPAAVYIYNNTVLGEFRGIWVKGGDNNTFEFINNISQGASGGDYGFTAINYMENNISEDSTSSDAGLDDTTVSFLNLTNKDFRLLPGAPGATDGGIDLSKNENISIKKDIAGFPRSGSWEIGAFESTDYSSLTAFDDIGSGTSSDPYILATSTQVRDIGTDLTDGCNASTGSACNSEFKLINSIGFSGGFEPIGDATNAFTGVFDGGDFQLGSVSISKGTEDYVGFFRKICGTGVIKNVSFYNLKVTGKDYVGGVAGELCGKIENVRVSGFNQYEVYVTGVSNIGGLVGLSSGPSIIQDSRTEASINSSGSRVGGLVGQGVDTQIFRTDALGDINASGSDYIGGLVGEFLAGNNDIYSSNSLGNIFLTGTSRYVGGAIGSITSSTDVVYSSASVDIFANGTGHDLIGGFVGSISSGSSITYSTASGQISNDAIDNVGGFVGQNNGTISYSLSSGRVEAIGINTGGFVGSNGSSGYLFKNNSFGDVIKITNTVDSETGGFAGENLNSIEFSFSSGDVYSNREETGGFVGVNESTGTIENSSSTGSVSGNSSYAGGFAGLNLGDLSENYAKGIVHGDYVGGFVGHSSGGTISDNYFSGAIFGNNSAGFAGEVSGTATLTDNYSDAHVVGATSEYSFINTLTAGSLNTNYWNSDSGVHDGSNTAASIVGQFEPLNSVDIKAQASFVGFDFTDSWSILEGRSSPIHINSAQGQCIENPLETSYSGIGLGSTSEPFIICNPIQFLDIASSGCPGTACNKIFELGADINFHGHNLNINGIGDDPSPFTGSFNGNGHSLMNINTGRALFNDTALSYISNLKIENVTLDSLASTRGILIGEVRGDTSISNVDLNVKAFNSGAYSGTLLGQIRAETENPFVLVNRVTSIAKIQTATAFDGLGGILGTGNNNDGIISGNKFFGTITSPNAGNVAGITASSSGKFKRNKVSGKITADGVCGGVSSTMGNGSMDENKSFIDIECSGHSGGIGYFSNSGVTLHNNYVSQSIIDVPDTASKGGLVGRYFSHELVNNFVDNSIINSTVQVGGLLGYHPASYFGVSGGNFWNTDNGILDARGDNLGGGSDVGRFVGLDSSETKNQTNFTNEGWDFTNFWAMADGTRAPELKWDLHPVCQNNMGVLTFNAIGSNTLQDPYKICFKEQLVDLANNCKTGSTGACWGRFELLNDISLKGIDFTPIGDGVANFEGYFNGNHHYISDLNINVLGDEVGFFGSVGASAYGILNVKLVLASVSGNNNVGVLAGAVDNGCFIRNIEVSGSVSGISKVGGAIGLSVATVHSIKANVNVFATASSAGGIFGNLNGSCKYCQSFGDVEGSGAVGGLVGRLGAGASLMDSQSGGEVIGDGDGVGGLVGLGVSGSILRSFAINQVTNTSDNTGGFIGENTGVVISNCYALGDVESAGNNVGGFIGRSTGTSVVSNSFSMGVPTGALNVGGFVGSDFAGSYFRNYWNSTTSGVIGGGSAAEYDPLTSGQMESSVNFIGWDFTNTWRTFTGTQPRFIPN